MSTKVGSAFNAHQSVQATRRKTQLKTPSADNHYQVNPINKTPLLFLTNFSFSFLVPSIFLCSPNRALDSGFKGPGSAENYKKSQHREMGHAQQRRVLSSKLQKLEQRKRDREGEREELPKREKRK